MAADGLWLSGAYGRDTVGIHFTWQRRPEVLSILRRPGRRLRRTAAAARTGASCTTCRHARIAERYPRFADFAALVGDVDPTGTFRNRTLDALLSPS